MNFIKNILNEILGKQLYVFKKSLINSSIAVSSFLFLIILILLVIKGV